MGVAASGPLAHALGLPACRWRRKTIAVFTIIELNAQHRRARAPVPALQRGGVALVRAAKPEACR